jgi:hypothetical protein
MGTSTSRKKSLESINAELKALKLSMMSPYGTLDTVGIFKCQPNHTFSTTFKQILQHKAKNKISCPTCWLNNQSYFKLLSEYDHNSEATKTKLSFKNVSNGEIVETTFKNIQIIINKLLFA